MSASALTILNPCGITPTISFGRESMVIVRPMTDGSPPKRRCQIPVAEHHAGPHLNTLGGGRVAPTWSAAEEPAAGRGRNVERLEERRR